MFVGELEGKVGRIYQHICQHSWRAGWRGNGREIKAGGEGKGKGKREKEKEGGERRRRKMGELRSFRLEERSSRES